jgi:hypothetical protein
MSSIAAGTTTGSALVSTGDTTGELVLKTNGTTTAVTIGTDQSVSLTAGLTIAAPTVFPAGSASAPSITTTGDTNTGIFFSAADTVDITTAGVAQAQINSAGDFAINSGYGSVATAYGCRAWVNFNGTGTVAIREDGNVSSITDNGAGDYTVNFTTAMPDANYAVVGAAGLIGAGARIFSLTTAFSSSSVRIGTYATSTAVDLDNNCVSIFR